MAFRGLLSQATGRAVTLVDRRRGLLVVVAAVVLLAAGTTSVMLRRPPVIAPALDTLSGGLFTLLSYPGRVLRAYRATSVQSDRIMDLELEVARLREAERENRRLRGLLGIASPPGFRALAGRVIGLDLNPIRGMAWINLGANVGLGGESVVTVDGLVGVVDAVWGRRSRIRLLINETTAVSARDTRSRVLGIVEWDPGSADLRVGKVPVQADIAPGDTLVSSGLGGVFAPGLPVGRVASVEEPPGRLLKLITLRPFASFFRLEEVFVLLPLQGPLFEGTQDSVGVNP